jgi:hypothetical protein
MLQEFCAGSQGDKLQGGSFHPLVAMAANAGQILLCL